VGLLLIFLFSPVLLALQVPDRPLDYIHDSANLLTADQKISLSSKLRTFEEETSNQIVVATFPSLEGESLEDFSIHLAEKWKVGQKGKDNGIILLIFPNDHRLRIEVGYGLESVVPDAYASRIIEEKLKPNFRKGDFFEGITSSVDSLIQATRGVYEPEKKKKEQGSWLPFLFFFLFFILPIFFRRRGGWIYYGGGGAFGSGGWSGGGGFSGGGGGFGGGGSSGSW